MDIRILLNRNISKKKKNVEKINNKKKNKSIDMRIVINEPSLINGFYVCNKCSCKMGDKKDCYKSNNKIINNIHSFDYICKKCKGENITTNSKKYRITKDKKNAAEIIWTTYKKYIKIIQEYEKEDCRQQYKNIELTKNIDINKCEQAVIRDYSKNKKESIYIDTNNNIYNNNLSLIGIMQKKQNISISEKLYNISLNKDGYILNPLTNNILYEFVINDKLSTLLSEGDDSRIYCEYNYIPSKGLVMTNEICYVK